MAKKNVRNIIKKLESSSVLINASNLSEYKVPGAFIQTEANKDPELIPHCFSSFCYLGLFVWLLLDRNYNLLIDRNSMIIIVTCYTIEFAKFACHSYLVSRITNQIKPKANPIFWVLQFIVSTVLAVGVSYLFSILFGAPLTTKQEQTFVFSVLETEWQRWPIPCSVGLIAGHLLANICITSICTLHNKNKLTRYPIILHQFVPMNHCFRQIHQLKEQYHGNLFDPLTVLNTVLVLNVNNTVQIVPSYVSKYKSRVKHGARLQRKYKIKIVSLQCVKNINDL
ncbi:hypothetical protein QTP88_024407 [Uroleucon formosanum]